MRRLSLLLLLLLPIVLQAQNQLVPVSEAAKLRRVWTQEGNPQVTDLYCLSLWGGADISGDSINDFAVYRGSDRSWLFYRGGTVPESAPFLELDSVGSSQPILARFFGDDRRFLLFREDYRMNIDSVDYYYDVLTLHEITGGSLASTPTIVSDQGLGDIPIERNAGHVLVADVNNDAIDDLIVTMGGMRIGHVPDVDAAFQAWIYFGGSDFSLDTPDVVVRNIEVTDRPVHWSLLCDDFDGDGRTDMVFGQTFSSSDTLRFYWGDEGSPTSWAERPPDRTVSFAYGQTTLGSLQLRASRLDADRGADIVGYTGNNGTYLYLSGRGDPRTRSFRADDADISYPLTSFSATGVGSLNNRQGRYDMLALDMGLGVARDQVGYVFIAGTADGPDHDYEAWYAPGLDSLRNTPTFPLCTAVGDVTGDGYEDLLYGTWSYGPLETGLAILLAGGPDIPLDDPSMAVEEYPVAREASGLSLWPNPVVDELHIAWKGNLERMPSRFAIYDLKGTTVVESQADPHRGEMLWRCDGVVPGIYTLIAYDAEDHPIAEARIVKR